MKLIMIYYNHILGKKIYNYIIWIQIAFVLSVHTKNIIQDLHNLKDYFDFSNLNKEHELFSNVNKRIFQVNSKLRRLKIYG